MPTLPRQTVPNWRERGAVSITEAARILGIGRTSAFDLVRRGELETIPLGRRRAVAVHHLRRLLGEVD
jgi:hypothetical protein